jgi:hypothetical protein
MAIYHVKNGGNDGLDGLSPTNAWATNAKVNASSFAPGDIIQWNGGDTFAGMLILTSSGTDGNPIIYRSYGTGQAIINITSHEESGIKVKDCEYVHVDNFRVIGSGIALDHNSLTPQNNWHGVDVVSTHTTGVRWKGVKISNNNVSGFRTGILVRADMNDGRGQQSTWRGYDGLVMEYNDVHDNSTGIFTWCNPNAPEMAPADDAIYPTGYYPVINLYSPVTIAAAQEVHVNLHIHHNKVYDIFGFNDIHPDNTTRPDGRPVRRPDYLYMRGGTGLRICNASDVIVEYNWVNNCGHMGTEDLWSGPYDYTSTGYGMVNGDGVSHQPANMEAELTNNLIWRYNESSNCRMMPNGLLDGAGLDGHDGWCNNTEAYGNYIHDNDGYVIGIGGFMGNTNDTMHFHHNICINNTKKVQSADIHWNGQQNKVYIYNNLIYNSGATNVICWVIPDMTNGYYFNNIIHTPNRVVYFEPTNIPLMLGNVYNGGGILQAGVTTLEAWRTYTHTQQTPKGNSNQEIYNGTPYGRKDVTITYNAEGTTPQMLPGQPVSNLVAYDYLEDIPSEIGTSFLTDIGILGVFPTTDFHGNTFSIANMKVGPIQEAGVNPDIFIYGYKPL